MPLSHMICSQKLPISAGNISTVQGVTDRLGAHIGPQNKKLALKKCQDIGKMKTFETVATK